jgi:hypothetical protein
MKKKMSYKIEKEKKININLQLIDQIQHII